MRFQAVLEANVVEKGLQMFNDARDDATNGLMWLRGETGEHGLHSLNFQNVGMLPWMQQRFDPAMLGNDPNQHYQAMLAAKLQNLGNADPLKQPFMQFQQPFQYLQQLGIHSSLLQQQQQQQQQQQVVQHSMSDQVLHAQTQVLPDNLPQQLLQQQPNDQLEEHSRQQQHTYRESFQIANDPHQQRRQLNLPLPSFQKTDFTDSNAKFSASLNSSNIQNMLGTLGPEGSGNLLNFSRSGQSMLAEQPSQQPWMRKFSAHVNALSNSMSVAYTAKDTLVEPENCSLDAQNHTLFGVNIDSSGLLLPTTVPSFGNSSTEADVSSMPLGTTGFQNSLYGMQDSSEILHASGQIDSPTHTRTFVKVYKSGSVGRSLDITQFSSYHELRKELGQMFGIEGKLEDPLRSGWQLVFVDRENDVLLLGDDPWDSFVNNVWYIKILSPEDVQKLGKPGSESFAPNACQRMSSADSDAQDLVSGLPSVGSLDY
ncbi:AUX/IAA domain [Dillenia turbinata]|uniref:Auxin-responsive protein n=1 Tax=Dillenia turbinata TaxID=194707 RepID=A0AAN8Z616_9MAGN